MYRTLLSSPLLTYLYNLYFTFPFCSPPFPPVLSSLFYVSTFSPSCHDLFLIFYDYLPMKTTILPVKIDIFVIERRDSCRPPGYDFHFDLSALTGDQNSRLLERIFGNALREIATEVIMKSAG
jgi:hypothetical protein